MSGEKCGGSETKPPHQMKKNLCGKFFGEVAALQSVKGGDADAKNGSHAGTGQTVFFAQPRKVVHKVFQFLLSGHITSSCLYLNIAYHKTRRNVDFTSNRCRLFCRKKLAIQAFEIGLQEGFASARRRKRLGDEYAEG